MRRMKCELGVISRADGSARMHHGDTAGRMRKRWIACQIKADCITLGWLCFTAVVCGVYGPVEVRAARELCDRATLEVVVRGETGLPSGRERQLEKLLTGCCGEMIRTELHPHTAISVSLQVESNDGSVLSLLHILSPSSLSHPPPPPTPHPTWSILPHLPPPPLPPPPLYSQLLSCMAHAICLALMDVGLPLRGVFTALTCSIDQDGSLAMDPTNEQQLQVSYCQWGKGGKVTPSHTLQGSAVLSFVLDRQGGLLCSHCWGSYSSQQVDTTIDPST